jgi:hypothetical protein
MKNLAFFGLYENLFIVLKEEHGEEVALDIFRKVMEKGLKTAYDKMGFKKGNINDFVRVLTERDNSVGLRVKFPEVTENKIVYQFYDDPFPGLKGKVEHEKLDDTFISFKIKHILGNEWKYKTTKHAWDGNEYTEYVITRI